MSCLPTEGAGTGESCKHKGIQINSLVPTFVERSRQRLASVATNGKRAMLPDSNLLPRFWAEGMTTLMYLRKRTPAMA